MSNLFEDVHSQVSLSGSKVKSKRNRVLPVPKVVRDEVLKRFAGNRKDNVFTLSEEPYNRDYFKTLWSRYKRQSNLLEQDQTLYSFRHTGAIRVFEKTSSLQKLQQVMGHSDMKVSLTYLRGLEVKQLNVEDLPTLKSNESIMKLLSTIAALIITSAPVNIYVDNLLM